MQNEQYITIDLEEVFRILMQKIVWIILGAVICGIGGFVVNWFVLKPVYQADAMIIVNTRDEQNVVVTNDQINSAKQLVNTYEVILKSDTVIEQVLNAVISRGLVSSDKYTTKDIKKKVTVSPVNNTQVMQISAKDNDPEVALALVDEILTTAPSIIIRTVKAGSVEVVSTPKLNPIPVSPKKMRNLALCVFAGGAVTAAFFILKELLDNTIKTDEDIRNKLNLPVLGVIPKTRESDLTPAESQRGRSRKEKEAEML